MEEKATNHDPRLDSRNYGHVDQKDIDLLNSLGSAKRIHFTHFTVPKLPWHDDDHKFGERTDDKQLGGGSGDEPSVDGDEDNSGQKHRPVERVRSAGLEYCHCGTRGSVFLDRWYCQECWENGDDEKIRGGD
jgi:hypothetical protein